MRRRSPPCALNEAYPHPHSLPLRTRPLCALSLGGFACSHQDGIHMRVSVRFWRRRRRSACWRVAGAGAKPRRWRWSAGETLLTPAPRTVLLVAPSLGRRGWHSSACWNCWKATVSSRRCARRPRPHCDAETLGCFRSKRRTRGDVPARAQGAPDYRGRSRLCARSGGLRGADADACRHRGTARAGLHAARAELLYRLYQRGQSGDPAVWSLRSPSWAGPMLSPATLRMQAQMMTARQYRVE